MMFFQRMNSFVNHYTCSFELLSQFNDYEGNVRYFFDRLHTGNGHLLDEIGLTPF